MSVLNPFILILFLLFSVFLYLLDFGSCLVIPSLSLKCSFHPLDLLFDGIS